MIKLLACRAGSPEGPSHMGTQSLLLPSQNTRLFDPAGHPVATPLLPVRKPGIEKEQFSQDLTAINQIVKDIYPVVLILTHC